MDGLTSEHHQADDGTVWVRDYVALGAVQGGFRARSAVVVVERARHPSHDPELVTYLVRHAEDVPADASIRTLAAYAATLGRDVGAAHAILDATESGASLLRVWDSAYATEPCTLHPVRLVDREKDLSAGATFSLPSVSRLDLLSAVRVALDVDQGITYAPDADAARRAIEDYTTSPPPSDGDWTPPPTWHLVVATGLAMWHLIERPEATRASPSRRALADVVHGHPRVRWDDQPVRDTTDLDAADAARRAAILAAGGIVMPTPAEVLAHADSWRTT